MKGELVPLLKRQYDGEFDLIVGDTVAFVPQNPFTALSPLTKIKHQFFSSMADVEKMLEMGKHMPPNQRNTPRNKQLQTNGNPPGLCQK